MWEGISRWGGQPLPTPPCLEKAQKVIATYCKCAELINIRSLEPPHAVTAPPTTPSYT